MEIRGSYQRGQRQFISLSNEDRTRRLQTKDVRGKNPSALRRHESMSPAKNCTGLTTLTKDSLSETTHLSAVGGLEDVSAAGCAWLTCENHLMGFKMQ